MTGLEAVTADAAEFLRLAVAAVALVLMLTAYAGYRRTHARRLSLLSVAFGTFVVRVLLVEHATMLLPMIPSDLSDILRLSLDLLALLLFSLAMMGNWKDGDRTARHIPE